jgi:hypothetical protein
VGVILLVALFERPNGSLQLDLPFGVTLAVEIVCIAVFAVRVAHLRRISIPKVFWHDKKNIVLVLVLAVSLPGVVKEG